MPSAPVAEPISADFLQAFRLAADLSQRLFGAEFVAVALPVAHETLRFVVSVGFPEELSESQWGQGFSINDGVAGFVYRTGKPHFTSGRGRVRPLPLFQAIHGQSMLSVPIRIGAEVQGVLNVGWKRQVRRPTPARIHLLELIADQIALTRKLHDMHRDLEESERRAQRLMTLNGILSRINLSIVGARNRQNLLARMCETITADGHFALAWIGIADPGGGEVRVEAASGEATEYLAHLRVSIDPESPYGQGPTGRALRAEGTQIISDLWHSTTFAPWVEYAQPLGLRSCIAARFQDTDGTAGALSVYSTEFNAFDHPEIQELMAEMVSSITFALAHLALVNQEATAEQKVRYLAYHDPLTGLPNRLLLEDRLHQLLEAGRRYHRSFAVCVIDLDEFKTINDSHGHHLGDRVLRQVTERLSASLRAVDTMARFGGDEFVVLVDAVGDEVHLTVTLTRLIELTQQPITVDDQQFHLSASIGAALFPSDGQEPELLVSRADRAMYAAKAAGGGCYRLAGRV